MKSKTFIIQGRYESSIWNIHWTANHSLSQLPNLIYIVKLTQNDHKLILQQSPTTVKWLVTKFTALTLWANAHAELHSNHAPAKFTLTLCLNHGREIWGLGWLWLPNLQNGNKAIFRDCAGYCIQCCRKG